MVWNGILANNIRELRELEARGLLTSEESERLRDVTELHPMSVTPYYLPLIDWSDPHDPIRKMAIPSVGELSPISSYDTSGERENTKLPGVQHKYARTALVLVTNRCAVYCGHCFRKRLVGLPSEEILRRFEDAVRYITEHREINNVLLSGGDPLVLSTDALSVMLEGLSRIDHLNFIRIGTRVPVVLPDRITEDGELTALFRERSRRASAPTLSRSSTTRGRSRRSRRPQQALQVRDVAPDGEDRGRGHHERLRLPSVPSGEGPGRHGEVLQAEAHPRRRVAGQSRRKAEGARARRALPHSRWEPLGS
jgi:lysine 2,3-aminomutase